MGTPNYVTKCGDCVWFGKIRHKYFCRNPGGLAKTNPITWCCYGKPRLDALEREEKGKNK